MKDAFLRWLYQACCESSSQDVALHLKNDKKYLRSSRQSAVLFENMKKRLGEDYQKWIFRFEEAENEKSAMREEWIYQQAFRDCFYLLRWMGVIRQE